MLPCPCIQISALSFISIPRMHHLEIGDTQRLAETGHRSDSPYLDFPINLLNWSTTSRKRTESCVMVIGACLKNRVETKFKDGICRGGGGEREAEGKKEHSNQTLEVQCT